MHRDARYRFVPNWELFGRVNNLFDKDHETFGVLGQNFFNGSGRSFDATLAAPEQFVTPAVPRAGWIGIPISLRRAQRALNREAPTTT
jgi:iron complex outermembrane receptor protein